MLTWPTKQLFMKMHNLQIVEEAAVVFDKDPISAIELITKELPDFKFNLLSKYQDLDKYY